MSDALPVIVLAFANEQGDRSGYLRNLPDEVRALRQTLERAQEERLCEVVMRPNATLAEIVDLFQSGTYRDRIAVFHYGGHADSFSLLLEAAEGQTAVADAGGLAALFGQQNGLQLVFLNGCSTVAQVEAILAANVSAVIATSQAIGDSVATRFAERFYHGLAQGFSVRSSYEQAVAAARSAYGGDKRRSLYRTPDRDDLRAYRHIDVADERWPWELHVRPGAEIAEQWNLPEAARQPLFGLPGLPERYLRNLPDSPFRYLKRFTRDDAALFFGRGYQIRDLYRRVTTSSSAPLILLYGQSGVGKSSLLAAGLLPRLERDYDVRYLRRDAELGLLGGVQRHLLPGAQNGSLADAWFGQDESRPLILIVDQVEEVLTHLNPQHPHELADFLAALAPIWVEHEVGAKPHSQRPAQGKVLLSFRKEWLAEVRNRLREQKLSYTEVPVERLDRRGIVEAILGPATTPHLRDKYGLVVSDELLPGIIADDLLADPGSAVAPTLQVLLSQLWEAARQRNYTEPRFTPELYQELRQKGLLLSDFLDQQLQRLRDWHDDAVASGLALDLLAFHTTPLGTAAQLSGDALHQAYAHYDRLAELVQRTEDLYLLVDAVGDEGEPAAVPATRLAHDTLAPLVRHRFDESDAPGQRARRILASRAVNWEKDQQGDPLDDADLKVVEEGAAGMRVWTPAEERLVEASRAERTRRQRRERLVRRLGILAVMIIVVVAAVAVWGWRESARNFREAVAQRNRALSTESRRLANLALQQLSVDPVASIDLSLRALLPVEGDPRPYVPEAEYALSQALMTSQERNYLPAPGLHNSEQVAIHDGTIAIGGDHLWLADQDLHVWATPTLAISLPVNSVQWASDGRLLSYDQTTLRVWQGTEQVAERDFSAPEGIRCAGWRPERSEIAVCAGSTVQVWSLSSAGEGMVQTVGDIDPQRSAFVRQVRWSPDNRRLAAWGARLLVWDSEVGEATTLLASDDPADFVSFAHWSADGRQLASAFHEAAEVLLWPPEPGTTPLTITLDAAVDGAQFIEQGLVVWTANGVTTVWSLAGEQLQTLPNPEPGSRVRMILVAPDGGRLLTLRDSGSAQLWDIADSTPQVWLSGHEGAILAAAWHPSLAVVATGGLDGTARVWDLVDGRLLTTLAGHTGRTLGLHWLDEQRLLTYSQAGAEADVPGALRVWEVFDREGQTYCSAEPGHCTYFSEHLPNPEAGLEPIRTMRWLDGETMLTTTWDGAAQRWHLPTGAVVTLPGDGNPDRIIVWSPTGERLLTYERNTGGQFWQLGAQNWHPLDSLSIPLEQTLWLPGGLLVSDSAGNVEWVDVTTLARQRLLDGAGLTNAVQLNEREVALADRNGAVYTWNSQSGEMTALAPQSASRSVSLDTSSDGRWLLNAAGNGELQIWDLREGAEAQVFPVPGAGFDPGPAKLSPDGRLVAVLQDGALALLDAATGAVRWQDHLATYLLGVGWDAVGTRLFTWDETNLFVLRWDDATQTAAPVFKASHGLPVNVGAPAWDRTGTTLFTAAGADVRVWSLERDVNDLIATAIQCCATRPLSAAQQTQFGIE